MRPLTRPVYLLALFAAAMTYKAAEPHQPVTVRASYDMAKCTPANVPLTSEIILIGTVTERGFRPMGCERVYRGPVRTGRVVR